jgi:hypothetical protein
MATRIRKIDDNNGGADSSLPSAIMSHFIIPPKMFTKIALTAGSDVIISNAALICSTLAPPPTSKKLAGDPPFREMISMVDIARPAPLTIQPIFPSSPM